MVGLQKIIIWDFDGVIVDSIGYKYEGIWDVVFEGEPKKKQSVLDFLKTPIGMTVNRYGLIAHALNVSGTDEDIKNHPKVKEYAEKYRNAAVSGVIEIGMFDGALETLKALCRTGHSMYIVSGGGSDNDLRKITEGLNITKFFRGIYGFGDIKMPLISFGKIENFKRVVDTEGVIDPARYVVIGDSHADYQLALDINCDFIGIPNKWNGWENNAVMKGFLVDTHQDIPARVGALEKQ